MGNCASAGAVKPDYLPSFCIRNPALTEEHMRLIRASWKIIMDGGTADAASFEHGAPPAVRLPGSSESSDDKPAPAATAVLECPITHQQGAACPCPQRNLTQPSVSLSEGLTSAEPSPRSSSDSAPDSAAISAESDSLLLVTFFDAFYGHLFEIAPQVRPLFRNSIKSQGRALVRMLDTAVGLLDRVDALRPKLEALALRHVLYGALPEHFSYVGESLFYALEQSLGPALTPDVRQAWLMAYSVMMSIMLPVFSQSHEQHKAIAAGSSGGSSSSGSSSSSGGSQAAVGAAPAEEAGACLPFRAQVQKKQH